MNYFKKIFLEILILILILFGLDQVSVNYLFFHVIVELFSIVIMCIFFTVTINAYKQIANRYLIYVGISGLFIGILDLLHTLTYDGMNIIVSSNYYANQFWIATRFFESVVLFTGFLYIAQKKIIQVKYLLSLYSIVTVCIILSILYFEIFPVCYIKGVGQTDFKIYSEYVIIFILSVSLALLVKNRTHFSHDTYILILLSITFTILSEFCFTLYFSNFDYVNKLGHVFKVLSFYMLYKANIANGFTKPIETFFRELKLNEEKIKGYSIELEKEIANRNKFFSIISHDLKNPFTVLMGYSELLLLKHKELNIEMREKYIENIYESTKQTLSLLENLLAWSRTQNKTITFKPENFDISTIIKKNITLLEKSAELKEIQIESNYSAHIVYADTEMIRTVLRNLITNAIKFTPRGGTISISNFEKDNTIITSISDTGIGMSEEKLNSLFKIDKTFSAKGTENETGTGLGLILCHEFITMNNGKIWAESEPGKGSTFYFSLKKENLKH